MAVVLSVVGKFDDRDLKKAQAALDKLKREAGDSASPLQRLGDGFKNAGRSMSDFGKNMTQNVTVPLLAVGYGVKKAIDAASDLSETQAKVGQIFGKSADDIEKFAETAATSLGQSKQQAMDAASQFAIFGQSAGLSGKELVGFSTELTTLATDLASFNNTSPEEAITAIGAALRGENEPIRRYGVLLDDASLRQEALRQGLIKTTKQALTPQQKVLAAQALIFKQTKTAQGDFARTSDGLANQQRILKAQLENVTAELGTALLPIALKVAGFFRDKVVPAIQSVVDWFSGLSDRTKQIILIAGGVIAALGPVITVIGTLTTAIGFLLSPIGLAVLAIAGLVAAAVYAYKRFDGFREVVDKAFTKIKDAASAVFQWLKDNWRTILDIITKPIQIAVGFIQRHWDSIKQIFQGAFQVIKGIFNTFAGLFTGDWSRLWNGLKDIVAGAGKMVLGYLKTFVGLIWDTFKGLPGKLIDVGKWLVEGIWNGISGAGSWLMGKLKEWALSVIPDWMKKVLGISSPSKVTAEIGGHIASGLAVGIEKGTRLVEKTSSKMVKKTLKAAVKQAKNAQKVFDTIRDAAQKSLDKIKNRAQNVVDFARNISDSMRQFGSITGFDVSAYQSAADELKSIDDEILESRKNLTRGVEGEEERLAALLKQRAAAQARVDATKVTAGNIIGDMRSRLATIKTFGERLRALKDLGLNNSSLQDIIAAGPEAGSEIAAALLAEGASAIGEVNSLESQLNNVASSIGDIGAMSEFGMTAGQAEALIDASITIAPGAVVVNIGAGVDAGVASQVQNQVNQAVENALKEIGQTSLEAANKQVSSALKNVKKAVKTAKPTKKKGR